VRGVGLNKTCYKIKVKSIVVIQSVLHGILMTKQK
jgi:hypothetical protein